MMRFSALPPAHAAAAVSPSPFHRCPSRNLRFFPSPNGLFKQSTSLQARLVFLPLALRAQDPDPVISEKNDAQRFSGLLLHCGALMASIARPALAVTGSNNNFDDDLTSTLIQSAIVAFFYFLVVPPVLMNWMRLRWYKRKFFEMYLQFMLVFIFFPGLLLWAPFPNFRKFPRDPSMKYPWSTPSDLNINSQKFR
uniref:NADH dehydrogenase subunit NdhL n=1 Tax=Wolffia australiana TaxID=161112 RepID=F8SVT7_WOLAU|nr:NADH dehydrogenase subunit NdhL [Wolffia australiana]